MYVVFSKSRLSKAERLKLNSRTQQKNPVGLIEWSSVKDDVMTLLSSMETKRSPGASFFFSSIVK